MRSRRANFRTELQVCAGESAAQSGERLLGDGETESFTLLTKGTLVADKYRVKGELGRGGFAVVYDAEHVDLRRQVALKVLHLSEGTPSVLIERFAREVRLSALVRHPHVLEVYDAGTLDDGSPFLAMEKIDGETLHEHLCRAGRLTVPETVELTAQLLSALSALAARGIVHRDIKPENLMLTQSGTGKLQLKLVDFGIALVRDENIEPRLTMHGALVGTPHYMAPEQLRSEVVDSRVDIYAAGVVMFQALTGSMPFDGADLSSLTLRVLNGKAPSLRALRADCPTKLVRVVERALARDPCRRYADPKSMLADLRECVARTPFSSEISAGASTQRPLLRTASSRLGRLLVAVAAMAAMLFLRQSDGGAREELPGDAAVVRSERVSSPSERSPAPSLDDAVVSQLMPRSASASLVSTAAEGPSAHPTREAALARAEEDEPTELESEPTPQATSVARAPDRTKALSITRKALALYLHGDLDAAYQAYRRALRADPDEPSALRGMGLSASRLGKTREAKSAYARYLELAPKAPDAELVRARLAALRRPRAPE